MKKADSKEQYVVSIIRQAVPLSTKMASVLSTNAISGAMELSEYDDISRKYQRLKDLVKKLENTELSSIAWIKDCQLAYKLFLDELEIAVISNPDFVVTKSLTFMKRTSEITGPYDQAKMVIEKLEAIQRKIELATVYFAAHTRGVDYSENQRALFREVFMESPVLLNELKNDFTRVQGAREHLELMSVFFIQALQVANNR